MFETDFDLIMYSSSLSNKEVANKLNASQQSVSDWRSGHRPIPKKYYGELLALLKIKSLVLNEYDKARYLEKMLSSYLDRKIQIVFDA